MKKFGVFLIVIVALAISLSACYFDESLSGTNNYTNDENNRNNVAENFEQDNTENNTGKDLSSDDNNIDDSSNNSSSSNVGFENLALKAKPISPNEVSQMVILDSYSENGKNYYLLDVGYIKNSYITTLALVNYTGIPISFSKTTTNAYEIQNSVSSTISESYAISFNNGMKLSIGSSAKFFDCGIDTKLEWNWSVGASSNIGKSMINTETSASLYSESQTIEYSFGYNEAESGFYRYALYGTLDVYYICVTDQNNETLISLDVCACARENDYFIRSEFSPDGEFDNAPEKDIVFEEGFYKDFEKPEVIMPEELEAATKYIQTSPMSCKLDNGYNYDQKDPNWNNKHFNYNYDFGQFVVSGGSYVSDNSFNIVKDNAISIGFRLEYDAYNLPVQDTMTSRYVSNDTKQSNFYKMPWNIGERTVGRGMIVALVRYTDGTPSDKICITNAFDGKSSGTIINIVSGITKSCTVEIAVCYELEMWAPGFLGISDNYWMNWRINQDIVIS